MLFAENRATASVRRRTRNLLTAMLTSILLMLAVFPAFQSGTSAVDCRYWDLVNSVKGERILSTATDLQDFGARAFFLSSRWNASTYIYDRFAELGLWVRYQDFQANGYAQRNVIAILNGTDPAAPNYLFGAHYDCITRALADYREGDLPSAPGADDDASGVSTTIELATVLHDVRLNSTVKFVAFGAEETGLNGSSAFVYEERASGTSYAGVTIVDMIGYRRSDQNRATVLMGTHADTMSESVQKAVYQYGLNLSLTVASDASYGWSDDYPFFLAGYPSNLIIEELVDGSPANPYYHTENDTVAHLSTEQMTVITKALLGGFLDLQKLHDEGTGIVGVTIISAVVIGGTAVVVSLYLIRRREYV